jgi:hypothetical protein
VVAVLAIILLLLADELPAEHPSRAAVTARSAWHSNTQVTLGGVLVLQAVIDLLTSLPDILTYWVTFWVSLLIAFVALWAMLYEPRPADV